MVSDGPKRHTYSDDCIEQSSQHTHRCRCQHENQNITAFATMGPEARRAPRHCCANLLFHTRHDYATTTSTDCQQCCVAHFSPNGHGTPSHCMLCIKPTGQPWHPMQNIEVCVCSALRTGLYAMVACVVVQCTALHCIACCLQSNFKNRRKPTQKENSRMFSSFYALVRCSTHDA